MLARIAVALVLAALATPSRAQAPYAPPPPSEPPPSSPVAPRAPAPPPVVEPPTTVPAPAPRPAATPTAGATPAATDTAAPAPPAAPADDGAASAAEARWNPPAPAGESSPGPDPSALASIFRGYEWAIGAIGGKGGMGEAAMLADLGRLAVGAMVSIGGTSEEIGAGLHLVGGPRFEVSPGVRIDVLGDAGLVFFGRNERSSDIVSSKETSGSDAVLPAFGARAGVTFTSRQSGLYLTLGLGVRHIRRSTVAYTETTCPILGACTIEAKTADYGGTVAGGFLTFGRAHLRVR